MENTSLMQSDYVHRMKPHENFITPTNSLDKKWSNEYFKIVSFYQADDDGSVTEAAKLYDKISRVKCNVLLEKFFLPLDLLDIDLGNSTLDYLSKFLRKAKTNVYVKTLINPVLSKDNQVSNPAPEGGDLSSDKIDGKTNNAIEHEHIANYISSKDYDGSWAYKDGEVSGASIESKLVDRPSESRFMLLYKNKTQSSKNVKEVIQNPSQFKSDVVETSRSGVENKFRLDKTPIKHGPSIDDRRYSIDKTVALGFGGNTLTEQTCNKIVKPVGFVVNKYDVHVDTTKLTEYDKDKNMSSSLESKNNIKSLHNTAGVAKGTFYCALCRYNSPFKGNIKHHVNSVHLKVNPHKCKYCGLAYSSEINLKRHINEVHMKKRLIKGSHCLRFVPNKNYTARRVWSVGLKEEPVECHECDYIGDNSGTRAPECARRHINKVDLKEKSFQCAHCHKCFFRKCELGSHIKYVHLKGKSFQCTHCHRWYCNKYELSTHINCVHNLKEKPFQCAHCGRLMTNKYSLLVHIKHIHQKKKSVKCTECNFQTRLNQDLKSHFKIAHFKEKPFQCAHCPFTAASKSNLTTHVNSAHKLKPFKCSHCEYYCSQRSHLNTHVTSVHDEERRFKCQQCDYSSTQIYLLNIHVRLAHNYQRAYKCPHCSYSADLKRNLSIHILNAHKRYKAFKCPYCRYACGRKNGLSSHIKNRHSNEIKPRHMLQLTQRNYF